MTNFSKLTTIGLVMSVSVAAFGGDPLENTRRAELNSTLSLLNRTPAPDSDIERPGWSDPEVRKNLQAVIDKYPNTEESLTAEFWLTTIRFEEAQSSTDLKLMGELSSKFESITSKSPSSWQAKAARVRRSASLFEARQWGAFRAQVGEVLSNIKSYIQEPADGYKTFLQSHKLIASDLEPEFRFLLIVAATREQKVSEAIALGEELQTKFPDWGKRNGIAGVVELLKAGKNPFGAP